MGMQTVDDDELLIAEHEDLQRHLDDRGAAERVRYERMNEDQKAAYEYEVRKQNERGR